MKTCLFSFLKIFIYLNLDLVKSEIKRKPKYYIKIDIKRNGRFSH